MFTPGMRLDVHKVWAYSPNGNLMRWFSGYVFSRYDGDTVLVKPVGGIYEGCEIRYAARFVRATLELR